MQFAFQKMRLETESYQSIIGAWVEMQLQVTPETAVLIGYGFTPEVAEGFTLLVLDWEATVTLPREGINLETGHYGLILIDEELYACRDQQKYRLADGPAVVEVVSVVE